MPSGPGPSSTQHASVEGSYTAEAIADLIDALGFLRERSPVAADKLEAKLFDRIARLAHGAFEGRTVRLHSGALVRTWAVPPFRLYYQRQPDELVVLRVYHQARRPIEKKGE